MNQSTQLPVVGSNQVERDRLVREIKLLLQKSLYGLSQRIEVRWHRLGVVISGCVPSYYDKQRVQEIIKTMGNVAIISNNIVVDAGSR